MVIEKLYVTNFNLLVSSILNKGRLAKILILMQGPYK